MATILYDQITLSIAVIGAILGLLNSYRSVSKDRIRVKAKTSLYLIANPHLSRTQHGLSIEIINLGYLPVTISGVYIQKRDKSLLFDRGIRTAEKEFGLPHRLASRDSLTVYFSQDFCNDAQLINSKNVLVKTACGLQIKNTNKTFKTWIKSLEDNTHAEQGGEADPIVDGNFENEPQ